MKPKCNAINHYLALLDAATLTYSRDHNTALPDKKAMLNAMITGYSLAKAWRDLFFGCDMSVLEYYGKKYLNNAAMMFDCHIKRFDDDIIEKINNQEMGQPTMSQLTVNLRMIRSAVHSEIEMILNYINEIFAEDEEGIDGQA